MWGIREQKNVGKSYFNAEKKVGKKVKFFRESYSRNQCFRNKCVIGQALQSKNSESLAEEALWNSLRERIL